MCECQEEGRAWRFLCFCFLSLTSLPPRRKHISKCSVRTSCSPAEWKRPTWGTVFVFPHFSHITTESIGGRDIVLHVHPLVLLYILLASVLRLSLSSFLFIVCDFLYFWSSSLWPNTNLFVFHLCNVAHLGCIKQPFISFNEKIQENKSSCTREHRSV